MRLYVGNVPYNATEGELQAWFEEAGFALDSVTLMRDRETGQARGFGFVEIYDDEEAQRAIAACNNKNFMGRALVINEARPRVGGGRAPMGSSAPRKGRGGDRRRKQRYPGW